ncbi:MAG: PilZ domain-containing protein [Candidatus Omnitrophota bacterium]
MNEITPAEKRIFTRFEENTNVRYKIIRPVSDPKEYFVVAKDLSIGGLAFVSYQPIPTNTILNLKVELLDGLDPIECAANVLRTIKIKEDGEEIYNVSVLFLDLSSADQARLTRYTS